MKQFTTAEHEEALLCHIPDEMRLLGLKTLSSFDWALESVEFDYLYRTNVSSYVQLSSLLDRLQRFPAEGVYAGVKGVHRGQAFASGSGYLLSRDVVQRVWDCRTHWDHRLLDDVALGRLIQDYSLADLTEMPRVDLQSVASVDALFGDALRDNFHFRCKTRPYTQAIKVMKRLHERLAEA